MNDDFIKHALSNGEAGKEWLDSIPRLISEFEKKWSIKVLPPFKLSFNYVAPAIHENGEKVVIKLGFPKDPEFQTEIAALSVFNGEGIEKLLEADTEKAVILIEQVSPGVPLSKLDNDDQTTRIIASVMKKLWKPLPKDHKFITIEKWSRELFQVREWYHGATGPLPEYLIDKACELFTELIVTQKEPMLVHGDLHHDNILSSDREEWLAIDPKGIAAEPCYETAAMLRNPYETFWEMKDLPSQLKRRIHILADELEFDPRRIQKWAIAQTVLSAVWSLDENGKGWEDDMRIAEMLDKITV